MGKDKTEDKSVEDWEVRLDAAEKIEREAADTHRVEVLVAINGHHAKDKLTVPVDHPFYSGLLDQNLARVID